MRNKFQSSSIALLLFVFCAVAQAKDNKLWGAVLLATNDTAPKVLPVELKPFQTRLENVFGYDAFQLLGKSSHEISDDTEQWLIPGKTFSVRSVVQPTNDSNFRVELQLYQGKKEIVQTVAKLGPRSPLFIRGPLYGNGQLIIVIMVRDDD